MSGYFSEADPARLAEDYPIGNAFLARFRRLSVDALRAVQEDRFRRVIARGWQVPFYARRWGEAGIAPGDIRSIDDLPRLPSFSKSDLMDSVERFPPFGDFHGFPDAGERPAIVFHTTSGTTGAPQPIYYGAWDREVQNALLARAYRLHGIVDSDVVHSVYGFGTVNGGHYIRETLLHFTKALLITGGTGAETPSVQQVRLMERFGATVLVGFGDYLFRLAEIAQQEGVRIPLRMISGHIAHDTRAALEAAWGGVKAYDWYGVGDTGTIAAEGPERDGLHLMEDAQLVELLDPETGLAAADGQPGNVCVTCLFKHGVYPVIRFDTKDLSAVRPGANPLDLPFRRIEGFLGRSDNMVKIKGINVYPTAIGAALASVEGLAGEYVCVVQRDESGRDSLRVLAETATLSDGLRARAEDVLKQRIGIAIRVDLTAPGGTASLTGVESRQKPKRLVVE
ncbi:MAG: phenylacetate--CoA ligase family protein [Alphaproteobacteria bacterium]|nr:phenylacetate--CoA ligase family protein [Alphaproteobacteria bacterium]